MNKNKRIILTIITILVSTMLFINKSYAAKELTCLYDNGLQDSHTMLVQFSDGTRKVYRKSKNASIDDNDWYDPSEDYEIGYVFNSSYYEEEEDVITSCPPWTRKTFSSGKGKYTFYFYDNKTRHLDYDLIEQRDEIPSIAEHYQSFKRDEEYSEEIKKTNWNAKCVYLEPDGSKIYTMYFNDEKYIVKIESSLIYEVTASFSISELKSFYNESSSCPVRLYNENNSGLQATENFYMTLYMSQPGSLPGYSTLTLDINESEYYETPEPPQPKPPINNCEELFGEELVDKINSVMNIIKIAVPILLIAFGIFDFSKAMFASNEDDMKKAQKTFLKRIVAAFIVFLSPMIINLILSLTNKVWSSISTNTCIKEGK